MEWTRWGIELQLYNAYSSGHFNIGEKGKKKILRLNAPPPCFANQWFERTEYARPAVHSGRVIFIFYPIYIPWQHTLENIAFV